MTRLGRVLLLLVCAASFAARAVDRILVVLPIDASGAEGKLSKSARASVEEMLRDEAANALAVSGWTVMTGESTQAFLQDSGLDVSRCSEGQCLSAAARTVNVDRFIGGAIQYSEGWYTASIRLMDGRTGNITASVRLESRSVRGLRKEFAARAPKFFERTGLIADTPQAAPQPGAAPAKGAAQPGASADKGAVQVTTLPPGARVLLDGAEIGRSPLTHALSPGSYLLTVELPGYAPQSRQLEVDAGKTLVFNEALFAASGFIEVAVSPAAAARAARVLVDGSPAGLGRQGPFKAGKHLVRAESAGFEPATLSVDVENGGTAAAKLALDAQPGALLVTANVEADCRAGRFRVHAVAGEATRLEVPPGPAHVVCARVGYREAAADAQVAPGAPVPLSLALTQLPAAERKPAAAEGPESLSGTVAVLDFRAGFKGQESQPVDPAFFSDAVRAELAAAAPALRLLSREELQAALAVTERLSACTADCGLDTGRRAGVDFVVAGEVLRTGGQYKLRLRMYRTANGAQVATLASGDAVDAVQNGIPASVRELVRGLR